MKKIFLISFLFSGMLSASSEAPALGSNDVSDKEIAKFLKEAVPEIDEEYADGCTSESENGSEWVFKRKMEQADYRAKYIKLQTEVSAVYIASKKANDMYTDACDDMEKLEELVKKLEDDVEKYKGDISNKESEIQSLNKKMEDMERAHVLDIEREREKTRGAQGEISQLNETIKNMHAEYDSNVKMAKELEKKCSSRIQENSDEYQKKIDELKASKEELEDRIKSLEKEKSEKEAELVQAQSALEDTLKDRVPVRETDEYKVCAAEVEKLKSETEKLKKDLSEKEEDLSEKEEELRGVYAKNKELSDEKGELFKVAQKLQKMHGSASSAVEDSMDKVYATMKGAILSSMRVPEDGYSRYQIMDINEFFSEKVIREIRDNVDRRFRVYYDTLIECFSDILTKDSVAKEDTKNTSSESLAE